jgi:protocatechuate 3,4-dioxygenase beta subunit
VELPVDRDADLTLVDGAAGPAAGEPLLLDGQLLTVDGEPVEGAVVEIWQTDDAGVYLHPQDPGFAARDTSFQGYGESVTDEAGAWSFRTILPEVYGGRPRHIHAKVRIEGETVLTTQIYFSGGDIPNEGTVEVAGAVTDALTIEALADVDAGDEAVLRASHLIVIPPPAGA